MSAICTIRSMFCASCTICQQSSLLAGWELNVQTYSSQDLGISGFVLFFALSALSHSRSTQSTAVSKSHFQQCIMKHIIGSVWLKLVDESCISTLCNSSILATSGWLQLLDIGAIQNGSEWSRGIKTLSSLALTSACCTWQLSEAKILSDICHRILLTFSQRFLYFALTLAVSPAFPSTRQSCLRKVVGLFPVGVLSAKRCSKQVYVSFNLSSDYQLIPLVEKRLMEEIENEPNKF